MFRLRKRKDDEGEVFPVLSAQKLQDIHERDWKLLEPAEQQEIVGFLKAELTDKEFNKEFTDGIRKAWNEHGVDWTRHVFEDKIAPEDYELYSFHFMQGMAVRNLLRELIRDEDLPTDTWDELYVPALLRACECIVDVTFTLEENKDGSSS